MPDFAGYNVFTLKSGHFLFVFAALSFLVRAVCTDCHDLPGYHLAAMLQRGFDGILDPAATGNLHTGDCHGFYFVCLQNGGQFFGIIAFIELGGKYKIKGVYNSAWHYNLSHFTNRVQINILGKLLIVILSVAKNLSFREVRTSITTMSTY